MRDDLSAIDFAAVFRASPDLYMLLSPDLKIIDVNNAYANATLIRRGDVAGRHLFEVFPDNPDDSGATGTANLHRSLQRVLDTRVADAMAVQKYDIRTPDGGGFEERFWSPVNIPVFNDAGELTSILHRAEDVTEYVRLREEGERQGVVAQELMSRNAIVEREIIRRAQEVQEANRRLQQANTEIAHAHDQKSFFFAAASHDIRQPLHAAMSYLSVLSEKLSGEERALAGKAEQSMAIAASILARFLDVALLDEGNVEPRLTDFAASDLLDRVALQSAKEAAANNIVVTIANNSAIIRSDPNLLESVVSNFVGNAIRHSEAKLIEIGYAADGAFPRISVRDTGKGIPIDAQERVFEEFVQLENPARDRRRGHGLGLAIAKRVAKALGARMGVESEPGRGSTFWVEAPLGASIPAAAPFAQDEAAYGLPGRRVLLVEDDELIADAMSLAMEAEGLEMRQAGTVASAVEILCAGFTPDMIISDFRLPDGDGAMAISQVRGALGATVPAVVLTGEAQVRRLGVSLEKCAILTKPAPIEAILQSLAHAASA